MEFNPAYLAGLIDGEGCVFIAKRETSHGKPVRLPHYVLTVSVCMVHQPLIEELAEALNATVLVHKKDEKNPKHRRAFEFVLAADKARRFLLSIYDHMIIKKEEARLGIMFQDHLNLYTRGKMSLLTVGEWEKVYEYREAIRLRLKALKRVSSLGASDWNAGEFGGHPMPGLPDLFDHADAEGQYRAKQELATPGVCNESVPAPKGKVDSALHGNMQTSAEMTEAHQPFRLVK